MNVTLNGTSHELADDATVAGAVAAAGADPATGGLAVAVNGDVVPRAEWERTELEDGQRVEVLRAVQGGR